MYKRKLKLNVAVGNRNCVYFIPPKCINITDGNILKETTNAASAGRQGVIIFEFSSLLISLFCNKCYKKSRNLKRKVATQIVKSGLGNC